MLRNILRAVFPSRPVVYDGSFFKEQWFQNWRELRIVLEQLIVEVPRWRQILDFGCGPGVMVDHMNDRGWEYTGCEASADAGRLYADRFGRYPERFVSSLTAVNMSDFDLFLSFDVLEHMNDQEIGDVLTRTMPIQDFFFNISRDRRTPGHINIKSDRAWLSFFEQQGLILDKGLTTRLRQRYIELRPGSPDLWDRNMFVLQRLRAS